MEIAPPFLGYENTSATAKLVHILKNDQSVENLKEKEKGILILDQTPFYAESGGQIGDKGIIIAEKNEFEVTDTLKIKGNIFAHIGCLNHGQLNVNDKVTANINVEHRQNVMRNHSATHLLHKALKIILGDHVEQKGSLVDSQRTRFDFSHPGGGLGIMLDDIIAALPPIIIINIGYLIVYAN